MAEDQSDRVKKLLDKNPSCYVLITCSKPKPDGRMEVEMIYDGEETLAAYLVESAQRVFDERSNESSLDSCP